MQQAVGNMTHSNGLWWLDRLVFKLKKDGSVDLFEIRDQTDQTDQRPSAGQMTGVQGQP